MPTVYLLGGPCNGQNKHLTQAQYKKGSTTCKGATYVHNPDQVVKGHPIVFDFLQPETGGGSTSAGSYAPHSLKGWGDVRKQVNEGLPTALRKMTKLNRAALSELHRKRKVGH